VSSEVVTVPLLKKIGSVDGKEPDPQISYPCWIRVKSYDT